MYVDDIKLAGKKQNIDPMWKVLNKEVSTSADREVRCDEVLFKSPEPHETCAQSRRCAGNSMSPMPPHLSHDNPKHKPSRNARAGTVMAHNPIFVGHLTVKSRSTSTVHPWLVRQGGCGGLTHHEHCIDEQRAHDTHIYSTW